MIKPILLTVAAMLATTTAASAQAEWPEQPITLIVPWAAGGGTDAVARMIAAGLEQDLGQTVNVVNRVGAAGVIGHAEMASAAPDGYTIGLATTELSTYYWAGTGTVTYEDYTPIAQINFDPSAIHVRGDSEWESAQDVIDAIRAAPEGTYMLSGIPIGGAAHLAFGGLLNVLDIDPNAVTVVPTEGAAPGFQQLSAGGVHIVASSLPEGAAMVDAGQVRALATIGAERTAAFPDVPTAEEALGVAYAAGAWRGIVAPAGLPDNIRDRLVEALRSAYDSADFQDAMAERGFGVVWAPTDEFAAYLARDFEQTGEIMGAIGIRQRD